MRYEGKSEADAVAAAAEDLGRAAETLKYRVVRDEKSFWGGRVVEIEVDEAGGSGAESAGVANPASAPEGMGEAPAAFSDQSPGGRAAPEGAMDPEAFSVVEATLTELLAAAGFLVELRRREAPEMLFELI